MDQDATSEGMASDAPALSYEENIRWLETFLGGGENGLQGVFAGAAMENGDFDRAAGTETPATQSEYSVTSIESMLEELERDTGAVTGASGDTNARALDAIDAEMRELLDMRDEVLNCLDANSAHLDCIRENIRSSQEAATEVTKLRELLVRADRFHDEDRKKEAILVHGCMVNIPMFPSIFKHIPFISRQSREIDQLRALSSQVSWTNSEKKSLKEGVLREARRVMTLMMTSQPGAFDILSRVAAMEEDELAAASMPGYSDKFSFDWNAVSRAVEGSHTPDDCQTMWLMCERSGINKSSWESSELERLGSVLHDLSGAPLDWGIVATHLDTRRLPIECLRAAQRRNLLPASAALGSKAWTSIPFTSQENEAISNLESAWDNHHSIVLERLANGRPKASVMSRISRMRFNHDTQPEHWTSKADEQLVAWVTKELRKLRLTVLENPGMADTLDFRKGFRGKPRGATAEQTRARWYHLAEDFRNRPQRYVRKADGDETWQAKDDEELTRAITELPAINGTIPWLAVSRRVGKGVASCRRRYAAVLSESDDGAVASKRDHSTALGANDGHDENFQRGQISKRRA